MKTLNPIQWLLSAAVLVLLSSCGKIPSAYQGTFVDQPSGTKLTLTSTDGTLAQANGKSMTATADTLQIDSLSQAKAGLYTRPLASNDKVLEIFWVVPDAATRQENSGFVWYTAEILYTRMQTDLKDPVGSITVDHCLDGMVMVDTPSKTWNGGCGANTAPMNFVRQASK